MSVHKMSVHKMSVHKMSVNKMTVDKMTINKMRVVEMLVDIMTVDEMAFCQNDASINQVSVLISYNLKHDILASKLERLSMTSICSLI
jgi:hypothetical protein